MIYNSSIGITIIIFINKMTWKKYPIEAVIIEKRGENLIKTNDKVFVCYKDTKLLKNPENYVFNAKVNLINKRRIELIVKENIEIINYNKKDKETNNFAVEKLENLIYNRGELNYFSIIFNFVNLFLFPF